MSQRLSRLRLMAGPVGFCLLDLTLTLAGQPRSWWAGDWQSAREGNLFARWLMHQHAGVFLVGGILLVVVYAGLLTLAPPNIARVLAFVILLAHAIGASTWVISWGVPGYVLAALLLLFASRLLRYSFEA